MAAILAKSKANDCSNPAVQVFFAQDSQLFNPFSVEYQVFRIETDAETLTPVQVFPVAVGTREVMDLTDCPAGSRIGTGQFAPKFTLAGDTGLHEVRYFFKAVDASSPELEVRRLFELADGSISTPFAGYCFPRDLRAEGFDASALPEGRLRTLIARQTRFIEQNTERFFNARIQQLLFDGFISKELMFDVPIITVDTLTILNAGFVGTITDIVEKDAYKVYNRHIRQQLSSPDDRDDPRISFLKHTDQHGAGPVSNDLIFRHRLAFPIGALNLQVDGVLGFTDPDPNFPGDQIGMTPELIREVCMKLVQREAPKMKDTDDREDAQKRHRLISEKTRDQSYRLDRSPIQGTITGDSEIDNILISYKRPAQMATA